MNIITARIEEKLRVALDPIEMELKNVSHLHEGHSGDNGTGESHFQLFIVSKKFEDMSRVNRQRMIYDILKEDMKSSVHALSIKALSESDYNSSKN
jgi:BolA protein